MRIWVHHLNLAIAVMLVTTGCATAGGSTDQLQSTVYATHRLVQDLSQEISGTVTRLSDTTAELVTRLDASDRELRELVSVAQENQHKLERLQTSLDVLTAAMFRQYNLSPPTSTVLPSPGRPLSGPPEITRGEIIVEPPRAPIQPDTGAVGFQPQVLPPVDELPQSIGEDAQYRQAQQLYANENYSQAVQMFREHLVEFPGSKHSANATYWLAHCYFKMGEYPQAISGFDELRAQFPESGKVPIAMHNEAVAYSRLGQNARAIELFQRLIREYPDDVATEGAREKLRQLQNLN